MLLLTGVGICDTHEMMNEAGECIGNEIRNTPYIIYIVVDIVMLMTEKDTFANADNFFQLSHQQ